MRSCAMRSTKRNGPEHTGLAPNLSPAASAAFGDIIIPERLRNRHWDGYYRTMASGVSRYGAGDLLAVPAITKDGQTISIEFTIQMLKGPAGEILGPVAVIRDVTKRFQREKELVRRLKELEAKAKGA